MREPCSQDTEIVCLKSNVDSETSMLETHLQVLMNGLIAGAVYVLVALGFTIILQISRFFDFSYAASMTVAAYVAAYVSSILGYSFIILALVGLIVASLAGSAFERFVYRPLRDRDSSQLVLILSSLGVMIVTVNFVSLIFGDNPRRVRDSIRIESVQLAYARITILQMGIFVVSIMAAAAGWLLLNYSSWGRIVRAASSDNELAISVGVETTKVRLQAVALGSALGGLAAILVALDTGITPSLGFRLLLPGLVAAIVGGAGSISGAILGGMAIGIVEQFGGWFVSTAWQDAILFAILIVFLLLRPQGILGRPVRRSTV
jgi:branched-chain amino acid transport system permease protein